MKTSKLIFTTGLTVLILAQSFNCLAYTKGQYKKAEKIFETVNFEKTMDQQLNQLVQVFQNNPIFANHGTELRAIFSDAMDYKALKKETISFYANNFTEKELDELIKFNQSPLGQKMQIKLPQLSSTLMKQVQAKVAKNEDKIEAQMMEIIKNEAVKLFTTEAG
jgi:hypothetical protein